MFNIFSLSFWDEVKSRYGFEMCSLKPYTLKCLKQSVHIEDVNPSCVMSLPSEICSINLLTIQSEDLKLIKVSEYYSFSHCNVIIVM